MATGSAEVDLSGIGDPQRPIALAVGLVLIVVGVAGLSGLVDADTGLGQGLVFGAFGVPFWLGVTAIVAGLIGVALSFYAGAGTTFNKVAAGLVLPAVALLAVTDWGIAVGHPLALLVGAVTLLLAVVLVVLGVVLFNRTVLAPVLPVVALLTVADWVLGLTGMIPASEAVNTPTIGLLLVLAVAVGYLGFEGGARLT